MEGEDAARFDMMWLGALPSVRDQVAAGWFHDEELSRRESSASGSRFAQSQMGLDAEQDEPSAYSWDYEGFGGTLTRLSDGASHWMQGDEASDFDEEWDNAPNTRVQNMLASAYTDVMELPEGDGKEGDDDLIDYSIFAQPLELAKQSPFSPWKE